MSLPYKADCAVTGATHLWRSNTAGTLHSFSGGDVQAQPRQAPRPSSASAGPLCSLSQTVGPGVLWLV